MQNDKNNEYLKKLEQELMKKSEAELFDIFFENCDTKHLINSLVMDLLQENVINIDKLDIEKKLCEELNGTANKIKDELGKKTREELIKMTCKASNYNKETIVDMIMVSEA